MSLCPPKWTKVPLPHLDQFCALDDGLLIAAALKKTEALAPGTQPHRGR